MKMPRAFEWTVIAAVLLTVVVVLNPADAPVFIWKGLLVSSAPVFGYWIDRSLFPYGRPDRLVDPDGNGQWETGEAIVFASAMLRRAIIMAACTISIGTAL